jgi:hypothetical protein
MIEAIFDRPRELRAEHIVSALANGLVIVDSAARIVWMDERAHRGVNGDLQLPVPSAATEKAGINCVVPTMEATVDGERRTLCVLRQTAAEKEPAHDLVAANEVVLSDTSWLTRTIVEKIKAWRLKDFRRIPTRYDRLACNYLASLCLAATRLWWSWS